MSEDLVLHLGLAKAKCKSCRKEIVWAFTTGGTKAPFEEDPNGHFILENGAARNVGPVHAQLELGAPSTPGPTRYTSHFATCEHADMWRKK